MFSGRDAGRLVELQDRLRRAQAVTLDLMAEIAAGACTRRAMPVRAPKAAKIDRLIELEAWTEAALALVELNCRMEGAPAGLRGGLLALLAQQAVEPPGLARR